MMQRTRFLFSAKQYPDGSPFIFEDSLCNIHVGLEDLNAEAARLAATIKKNLEEFGV